MKNHLTGSISPYLLQHADNPVDWYPWGEEAFSRARIEDKPIFLSIGYSACHWCHVMAHESFENETVAAFLNDNFVSIKVDREQRPDIDDIYMSAVQATTGSGGWPLSVFLTPDLKPFYGGTYFPPVSGYGRPGFMDLLKEIKQTYKSQREKINRSAEKIQLHLSTVQNQSTKGDYSPDIFNYAINQLADNYDQTYGGFGPAPKFPPTGQIDLLLRQYYRNKDHLALQMAEFTLRKMAEGGMCDKVGGGFHRYSTDEKWFVPHFEKMLYDNALLVHNYLDAYLITKKVFYSDIAKSTLEWILREMIDPAGGFHSSVDADSEGEEGKYYLWTSNRIRELIADQADFICDYNGITDDGNFEKGLNILHVSADLKALANKHGLDVNAAQETIKAMSQILLKDRESRIRPGTDDKVLVDWNSLMISAFAKGYRVLKDKIYLDAANKATDFIFEKMFDGNELKRSYRDGKSEIDGLLDDYAYLTEALIELYQAGFEEKRILQAETIVNIMLTKFRDVGSGAFYQTAENKTDLILRLKSGHDSATPSGNYAAARALYSLFQLTGDEEYFKYADETVKYFSGNAERYPLGYLRMISLINDITSGNRQLAVIRSEEAPENDELLNFINSQYLPDLIVASCRENENPNIDLLKNRHTVDKKSTAYYCVDFNCKLPITDIKELQNILLN
ncbi:thioredoxin domain-containing protein [bacterium]|nr:thioredoxin domain-containing protein [bacterium]